MSVAAHVTKIDELLRCAVCLEAFDDPRQLPCRHVFCGRCVAQVTIAYRQLVLDLDGMIPILPTCPLCRTPFRCRVGDPSQLDDVRNILDIKDHLTYLRMMSEGTVYMLEALERDRRRLLNGVIKLSMSDYDLFMHRKSAVFHSRLATYDELSEMVAGWLTTAEILCRHVVQALQPFPPAEEINEFVNNIGRQFQQLLLMMNYIYGCSVLPSLESLFPEFF